jgi:4-amino-4-deoxy-L-arabinose transferase-like glycosyltransferase
VHTEATGVVRAAEPAAVFGEAAAADRTARLERLATIAAIVLIVAFALFSLIGLDRLPMVHVDEPWIAEPGYLFWQHGALVSELNRGFFGSEHHFLLHAPTYTLMSGAMVALFGPGLLQVRLLALAMAVLTAAFTFALGRTLISARHGLLAVIVLTIFRVAPEQQYHVTGIPLTDLARIARYDIPVPMFGLAALLLILPLLPRLARGRGAMAVSAVTPAPGLLAPERPAVRWRRTRLAIAGACAGLAFACHPVGLVWIAIVCAALVAFSDTSWRRPPIGALTIVLIGAAIVLAPWIWFVIDGWSEFVLQQSIIGERYNLLSPRFYALNVINEWHRYSPIGRGLLAFQPAAWLLSIAGIVGFVAIWIGARRDEPGVRLLRIALTLAAVLFAAGVRPKQYGYVAAIWPLIALTAAMGLTTLMQARRSIVRMAAIALLAIVCADGVFASIVFARRAIATTPYPVICERLRAQIPRGAKVVALPTWWFGLAGHVGDYRSLIVPVSLVNFEYPTKRTLEEVIDEIDPDVLVLDPSILLFIQPRDLAHEEFRMLALGMREYLDTHSVRHVTIDDPSYGRFEIHDVRR